MSADGDHLGDGALTQPDGIWEHTVKTATAATILTLSCADAAALALRNPALRDQLERHRANTGQAQDRHGQAAVELSAGHEGEVDLPGTFVDYELTPANTSCPSPRPCCACTAASPTSTTSR